MGHNLSIVSHFKPYIGGSMEIDRYIIDELTGFLQAHEIDMDDYYVINKEELLDFVIELVSLTDLHSVYKDDQVKYVVSDSTGRTLLAKYKDEICSTSELASVGRYNWDAELTQEEIEQYDYRYMVFAKKVEDSKKE